VSQERIPRRHSRFSDRTGLDAWNELVTFFNLIGSAVAAVLEPVKLSNDELLVLICLAQRGHFMRYPTLKLPADGAGEARPRQAGGTAIGGMASFTGRPSEGLGADDEGWPPAHGEHFPCDVRAGP
jgi:hypothetical protein